MVVRAPPPPSFPPPASGEDVEGVGVVLRTLEIEMSKKTLKGESRGEEEGGGREQGVSQTTSE